MFNSRFFEFFDWSAWLLFETALGVRPADLATAFGIVGIPLVDARARFLKPARFNDLADIASEVSEFRRSSFEVRHRISIGGELAVEGTETRVWAAAGPGRPDELRAFRSRPRSSNGFKRLNQANSRLHGSAGTGSRDTPRARSEEAWVDD